MALKDCFISYVIIVCGLSTAYCNSFSMKHGIESVTQVSLSMSGVGAIHYKGNLKQKLTNLKNKAKDIDKDEASDVQEGVGSIGEGLEKLVNGIKEGSWKDVLSGGLDIIGAVIGFVGAQGALFSAVLSLLSSCFGIFGGITGDNESTEDMLKRVIDATLDENTADSIRAEANAVKKVFTSMQYVISTYREQETSLSKEQAMKLYDLLFTGVGIFGEIEYYVKKWCEIEPSSTKNKKKIKKDEQDAGRCLDLLNLYCDLSILRQLLLADMSSVLVTVNNIPAAETILKLVEKEQKADANFLKILSDLTNYKEYRYINNILHSSQEKYPTIYLYLSNLKKTLENEQRKSRRSPMVSYHPMFLPKDDPKLNDDPFYQTKSTIDRTYVLICSEKNLKGYCYEMTRLGYFRHKKLKGWENQVASIYVAAKIKDESGLEIATISHNYIKRKEQCIDECIERTIPKRTCHIDGQRLDFQCFIGKDWDERIKSMYIPKGLEVRLYTKEAFASATTYGPFVGPLKIQKFPENLKWKSMKIWEKKYKSSVRICTKENLSGFCDHVQVPDSNRRPHDDPNIQTIHGIAWTEKNHKITSMQVPGGAAIQLFSEMNYAGVEVGPYTGPVLIKKIDGADSGLIVKSFKISKLY